MSAGPIMMWDQLVWSGACGYLALKGTAEALDPALSGFNRVWSGLAVPCFVLFGLRAWWLP